MVTAFNMNNKFTGQQVMANAKQFQMMARKQGGSSKGYQAIYLLLDKVLTLDLISFCHWRTVVTSNNAKS